MKTLIGKILSPQMKMADLVETDYRLLTVLQRFGLGLGFGERTVAQVCAGQGVDIGAFLLICNMYSRTGYVPDKEILKSAEALTVVDYLHTSHSYYLEDGFRTLEVLIQELVRPCSEKQRKIILDFFEGYKTEVKKHFEYEEGVFFPYVRSVAEGCRKGDYSAAQFEENHSNIEAKLSDLKNIVMKYLPECCSRAVAGDVIYALFSLSEDLDRHTSIEDRVLVPMVSINEECRQLHSEVTVDGESEELSLREEEVLICVAKGMINKEIADTLNISVHTVISHRRNIGRKTGIKTVAGLTVYALLNGLLDPGEVE